MPLVRDVADSMETLAPLRAAEPWDNVGLLLGDPDAQVERVLLTIDLTEDVLDEALKVGADAIVAYHPPIFDAFKRLTATNAKERIILRAANAGIAIYSPHTALDAAKGGVNDWLASGLGGGDVRALVPHDDLPTSEENKVVTFCPADAVDRIRHALSTIGAGRIGNYNLCSFELRGTGTFFAGEGARPTVGRPGQVERIDEVRLEMVCPSRSLALAVQTIRNFHPYEEPPIEIYPLRERPQRAIGAGRRITLDQPMGLNVIVERLRKSIGSKRILAATGVGAPRRYQTIGVCAGSGASILDAAVAEGCHLFITGEMSHHTVLSAQSRGCTVVLAGHTNTERGYLKVLRKNLADLLGDVEFVVSRKDCDPLKLM